MPGGRAARDEDGIHETGHAPSPCGISPAACIFAIYSLWCAGVALVPQQPDLYTRIHHRIVAAVLDVLPIKAVCSTDEFAATVAPRDIPAALTHQIKQRLRDAVGDHITCSIGYAPNRWLAKIAADLDKPDGLTVLHPRDLPGRLLTLDLEQENARLKRLVADQALDNLILKEVWPRESSEPAPTTPGRGPVLPSSSVGEESLSLNYPDTSSRF